MSDENGQSTLQDKIKDWITLVGGIGAISYAVGFIAETTRLLNYGIIDWNLLNARYLSAGFLFIILLGISIAPTISFIMLISEILGEIFPKRYLFSWDEIPGNDSGKFVEFLSKKYSIDGVEENEIQKIDDKTRKVSHGDKAVLLTRNDDKVNLEINDGRTDEFIIKTENGKLNIYPEKIRLKEPDKSDKIASRLFHHYNQNVPKIRLKEPDKSDKIKIFVLIISLLIIILSLPAIAISLVSPHIWLGYKTGSSAFSSGAFWENLVLFSLKRYPELLIGWVIPLFVTGILLYLIIHQSKNKWLSYIYIRGLLIGFVVLFLLLATNFYAFEIYPYITEAVGGSAWIDVIVIRTTSDKMEFHLRTVQSSVLHSSNSLKMFENSALLYLSIHLPPSQILMKVPFSSFSK